MGLNDHDSLANTSESQRYLRVLNGGSITTARIGQTAGAGKEAAARIFGSFKDNRRRSREAADVRRAIESGRVKDIE